MFRDLVQSIYNTNGVFFRLKIISQIDSSSADGFV